MVQRGQLAVALLILAFLGGAALADGKVFVTGTAKVRIPDQSALIVFDGKTERLVIETAAEGEGQEFAWVVPLPAQPKIEPVSAGIFPTLRVITRPRVLGYSGGVNPFIILAGAMILAAWVAMLERASQPRTLVIVLISFTVTGLLLGSLSTAGSNTVSPIGGAHLLERNIIGSYETATISGESGGAIRAWLEENGFHQSEAVTPVLDDYARSGWVFVAAKLRREAGSGRFTPHPLSFTFPTDKAIYPLRLTGVENGPLDLDLYVAAASEARAGGLQRRRAARLAVSPGEANSYFAAQPSNDDAVPVFHEALAEMLKGRLIMTVLSGRLTPEQMREDLVIETHTFKPYRRVYLMREGALQLALNCAAGFLAVATFIVAMLRPKTPWRYVAPLALPALSFLIGAGIFFALPKIKSTEVADRTHHRYSLETIHRSIAESALSLRPEGAPSLDVNGLRDLTQAILRLENVDRNPLTGLRIREEDSPGNCAIGLDEKGQAAYYYYDENGVKVRVELN